MFNNKGFEILEERGFVFQATHLEEIKNILSKGPITFYMGIDPTADDLHIGHFFGLQMARILQECGHKCIVLVDDDVVMVEPNIVFTNIDEVYNNGAIMKALASLSIGFDDDSNGNYYLYDTVGSIVDKTMSSKIRTLEPLLDGSSITTDTIYNITWNVPNKNSMIHIENDKTLQDYQKKSSF